MKLAFSSKLFASLMAKKPVSLMSVNGCAACINYGIKHQNGPVTIMVGGCNVMGHH